MCNGFRSFHKSGSIIKQIKITVMKATNSYSIFTNRGFLFVLPAGAKYDLFSSEVFNSIDCADDYLNTICETSNVMYMKRGVWAMSANERISDIQNSINERYI